MYVSVIGKSLFLDAVQGGRKDSQTFRTEVGILHSLKSNIILYFNNLFFVSHTRKGCKVRTGLYLLV